MRKKQDDRPANLEELANTGTPLQDERIIAATLPTITLAEGRMHLELSPDAAIMIDASGGIVLVNEQAATLFGYDLYELHGHPLEVLVPERFHTAYRTYRHAYLTAPLRRSMGGGFDLVGCRKDGREFSVDISLQPILLEQRVHVIGTIRDITDQLLLEQAQASVHLATLAQRTFLQLLLDVLPSGIYVVHGRDARLVLANHAAASIWGAGWSPGQPMCEFLEEHHIRIIDTQGHVAPLETWATMRALLNGEIVLQHQESIRQPGGTSVPILVNALPLTSPYWRSLGVPDESGQGSSRPNGEPLALVIHQDIRLLKEIDYAKDEFIGIATHELRQPLAVLKAALGTLILQTQRGHGPRLASWQQEMLQDLDQATDRLCALTEDLLDVSRVQAGQLVLQCAPTNLVSLVQRLVDRFQKTTTRHQLVFQPRQPTLSASIDPRRMEQVLSNLLTNAIKYSPQGGSIVVEVGIAGTEQALEIRVQDDGIGIPLIQQSRIFGRFMRADNARAAGISGTGLGLYLCRAIVEQHAGRLWFKSEEGEGTTFFVTIPLVASFPNQA